MVAKVKGTDEILGGYNPLAWDNTYDCPWDQWMETKDSFIFSLKNGNIQNSILSRVKKTQFAIANISKNYQNRFGLRFGDFFLYSDKSDFTLDNLNQYYVKSNYEEKIRTSLSRNFSIVI
ncbi:hypothetical protein Glove_13g148 [Diversispora epigaea]|uniref:TLDc domain-containing protein n=1 Tax=Diversispora epigaea TaxID=1348612 RepID=A0A397JTZ3_9GLOM|nr:hypothetical protein Glove_13g148 [Diversispora epigaea]